MRNITEKNLLLRVIKTCYKKQKKYVALITIIMFIKTILPFVTLLTLQRILNYVQNSNCEYMEKWLLINLGIYFGTIILCSVFEDLYEYYQGVLKMKLNYDINCMVINKSMDLSLSDYEDSDTYDKLQRAIQETQTPCQCMVSLFGILNSLITVIGYITILISWNWYVVLILTVLPIISAYFTVVIGKYEYKVLRQRVADSRKIGYFRTLISDVASYKENKILGINKLLFEKFKNQFQKFIKKDKEILRYKVVNSIIFRAMENIVGLIVIFRVFKSLVAGKILIGTTYTYINCVWNSIKSIDLVIDNIAHIYNKMQYVGNIFEFIDEYERKSNDGLEKGVNVDSIISIEFKNVSFKYREELPYVLKDVNCKMSKGEKIVIVGNSGSGKSTFIKLLCGLYSNYEGEIMVNGISLANIDKKSYCKSLGVVFQDFVKYEFSLRESLNFGCSEKTQNDEELEVKVENVISKGILTFLKELKFGLGTQLGSKFDKGVQLSGGQWQQVSFVRTILRDTSMYIFDEPSSSLDVVTEENMYKIMKELLNENLCIFVTHRLYNINNYAERALVFKDGKIIEDNRIDHLLAYDSYYRYMYDKVKC